MPRCILFWVFVVGKTESLISIHSHVSNEESDQTAGMCSLIWVFAECIYRATHLYTDGSLAYILRHFKNKPFDVRVKRLWKPCASAYSGQRLFCDSEETLITWQALPSSEEDTGHKEHFPSLRICLLGTCVLRYVSPVLRSFFDEFKYVASRFGQITSMCNVHWWGLRLAMTAGDLFICTFVNVHWLFLEKRVSFS